MNARIADLIREGRADEITDAIAEGDFFQMQTFTQALIELVLSGEVDAEVAANAATNRHDFLVSLEQALKAQAHASEQAARRRPSRGARRRPTEPRRGQTPEAPPALRSVASPTQAMTRTAVAALAVLAIAARNAPGAVADRVHGRDARAPSRSLRRDSRSPLPSASTPNAVARRPVVALDAAGACPSSSRIAQLLSHLAAAPAPRTASRGRCSRRSTRSSRTSAATWARARPARSAGCSSCRDTWLRWGDDANGDGVADPWNPTDAIFSAARYLAAAGGARPTSTAASSPTTTPTGTWTRCSASPTSSAARRRDLDSTGSQAVSRRARASAAADAGDAADRCASAPARRLHASAAGCVARADRRASSSPTGSHLEQLAGVAGRGRSARRERTQSARPRCRSRLGRRLAAGARPAQEASARRFVRARAVATLLGAPSYSAAATSSRSAAAPASSRVAHTHHDYPAADIAAPEGSPLYALADSVVVDAWTDGRPALRDRLHDPGLRRPGLDVLPPRYLEPNVVPGAALAAGEPVGLVGLDRPRDRPAPPSPAPAGDSCGRSRRPGSSPSPAWRSAGRTRRPPRPSGSRPERAAFHGRRDQSPASSGSRIVGFTR